MFRRKSIIVLLSLLLTTISCASGVKSADTLKSSSGDKEPNYVTNLSVSGEGESVEVMITANGPIHYTVFKMDEPKRLIVDMSDIDMSDYQSVIPVRKSPVGVVRPYYFATTKDSRLQIDLDADINYNVDNSNPSKLLIQIARKGVSLKTPETMASEPAPAPSVPEEPPVSMVVADNEPSMESTEIATESYVTIFKKNSAPAPEPEPVMETMTITDPISGLAKVENVSFKQVNGLSRIEITMSQPEPSYELIARKKMNRLTVDLPNALVEKKNEKLMNVSLDNSAVRNIAVFQFRGGDEPVAKIVVNLEEMALYDISSDGRKIILNIGDESVLALAMEPSMEKKEDILGLETVTGPEKKYTGVKISLDFQKADIHNILRILADVSGFNIITSDNVKGQVTMKLKDVPWDQAIEVILKNNGLDMIKEGNIIRIATTSEIQKEKEAQEKRLETEKKIEPLYTKIFEVNYESATKMKENIEALKTERGTVDINERTNTLIVKDTKAKLAEMSKLIDILDKKEVQVLIEARIVEVTHQKARELGIQWGGNYNDVLGTTFPHTVGVTGGTGSPTGAGQGGYAVNLPTASAATGGIGITLGHINGTALLDARLMALENSGMARIVSMPKITTMNNKEAMIESGQEIPYQTISSEGTKTEFKKATLSLKVTPHVTPDKHIRLEIETHKDEPDFSNQLPGAPPPILTKQATTEVLVADGDTTVIGGLFKDTNTDSEGKVPLFGDIPFLGWLFKSDTKTRRGEELLIFITPKIVE